MRRRLDRRVESGVPRDERAPTIEVAALLWRPDTSNDSRSRRVAKRVRPSTPSGRRLAVPTLDLPNHRINTTATATTTAVVSAVQSQ
jgi:hypothetical protein